MRRSFYQFPGSLRDLVVQETPITTQGADSALAIYGTTMRSSSDRFDLDLFVSPDPDPTSSVMISFNSRIDLDPAATRGFKQVPAYVTPYMRVINDRLVATTVLPPNFTMVGFLPAGTTWKYDADSLLFGGSVKFPVQTFGGVDAALKPSLYTDFVGSAGEVRVLSRGTVTTTLFAADGSVKASSTTYPMQLDLSQRGAYKIQAVDNGIIVAGLPRKATVTMNIDSNRADYLGPTLTSMNLLDAFGRMAMEIPDYTAASLMFSAADYSYPTTLAFPVGWSIPNQTRTYQQIRSEATKVFYRYAPSAEWQPLTATQVTEDTTAGGILYRVDLTAVANILRANVDMRFDIADVAGNTTSYTMEPAFQVVHVLPSGRRPGRR